MDKNHKFPTRLILDLLSNFQFETDLFRTFEK